MSCALDRQTDLHITHTHMHTLVHIHMHTLVHIHMHTLVHTYVRTYTHTHTHTHTHTRTHTHTHTHTQLFGGLLIALESLPSWISWMKYLSFVRYSLEVRVCVCVLYNRPFPTITNYDVIGRWSVRVENGSSTCTRKRLKSLFPVRTAWRHYCLPSDLCPCEEVHPA